MKKRKWEKSPNTKPIGIDEAENKLRGDQVSQAVSFDLPSDHQAFMWFDSRPELRKKVLPRNPNKRCRTSGWAGNWRAMSTTWGYSFTYGWLTYNFRRRRGGLSRNHIKRRFGGHGCVLELGPGERNEEALLTINEMPKTSKRKERRGN